METRPPLVQRLLSTALHLRYKWFGKGPSLDQWEERLQRVVAETVEQSLPWIPRQDARLLDIGANVGIYTEKILAERPDCRAWLFEPVRAHYERCRERLAKYPNVVVEHCALGDTSGPMTIWKPKHNPGGNVIDETIMAVRKDHMDFRPEPIECRIFDEYAREHGIDRVDFVKSDTEGFDYRVLRGMLGFLERCEPRPVILAELLSKRFHPDWPAQMAVLDALYRLGYQRVDLSRMNDVQDFLFVPSGRRPLD
jgi:FkbM family methyltransferase